MKALYYLRLPLIIFVIGYLILQGGGLLKIRHWPMGDELIMLGYFVIGIAGLIFLFKLIFLKAPIDLEKGGN